MKEYNTMHSHFQSHTASSRSSQVSPGQGSIKTDVRLHNKNKSRISPHLLNCPLRTSGPTGEQCPGSTALQAHGVKHHSKPAMLPERCFQRPARTTTRLQLCSRVCICCTSLIDSVVSPTSGKQQRGNLLTSQVLIN